MQFRLTSGFTTFRFNEKDYGKIDVVIAKASGKVMCGAATLPIKESNESIKFIGMFNNMRFTLT